MAYADFDLKKVVRTFGLTEDDKTSLFKEIEPIEPSDFLRPWLDDYATIAMGINTEKARSEFIIAPMLAEMMHRSGGMVNVLPGVTFGVDPERGLVGFCDYLIAQSRNVYYVQAPVLAVVEAKREDIVAGLGQCAAEMVAIQLFNEREGEPQAAVHGCVTSGTVWRFLRLQGQELMIDLPEYYFHEVAKILGILVSIARGEAMRVVTS
jgi:hypothetical protein